MQDTSERIAKSIRMRADLYHQARVASVVARKSLGQWLEEAIREKLVRERDGANSTPGSDLSGGN